jgi:hypothetical protein
MIDAAFIDELRARLSVSEVVGKRVRLKKAGREWKGLSPFNKERTPSFFVNDEKRFWYDFSSEKHGDIFTFIMETEGVTFPEAVMRCAAMAGIEVPRRNTELNPESERRQTEVHKRRQREMEQHEREEERKLRLADAIWREAVPIADTPGEDYLALRGIDLDDVPDRGGLRFHSHCPWGNGRQPCIVARFTHAVTGAPLGIHRRPISIPGAKPMSLGPISGGVIRLWPDEEVTTGLVIGEGVETTLAAATRITHHGTLLQPAWACGSAHALETFPPLAGIEELTILSDHDASGTGQKAAERCGECWAEAGTRVVILTPVDVGVDFNDLVRWTRAS